MKRSKEHEKRPSQKRTRDSTTPQPREERHVIGSSCTWGKSELEHFNVTIRRDWDPREVIPAQFFDFTQLSRYEECNFASMKFP